MLPDYPTTDIAASRTLTAQAIRRTAHIACRVYGWRYCRRDACSALGQHFAGASDSVPSGVRPPVVLTHRRHVGDEGRGGGSFALKSPGAWSWPRPDRCRCVMRTVVTDRCMAGCIAACMGASAHRLLILNAQPNEACPCRTPRGGARNLCGSALGAGTLLHYSPATGTEWRGTTPSRRCWRWPPRSGTGGDGSSNTASNIAGSDDCRLSHRFARPIARGAS